MTTYLMPALNCQILNLKNRWSKLQWGMWTHGLLVCINLTLKGLAIPGKKILSEDNSAVIFDEEGNLAIAPTRLYNCYRSWYDRANPEDRQVSLKKFGMIMKEILGATKNIRDCNQVFKIYQSDFKSIGNNIKNCLGFDPQD